MSQLLKQETKENIRNTQLPPICFRVNNISSTMCHRHIIQCLTFLDLGQKTAPQKLSGNFCNHTPLQFWANSNSQLQMSSSTSNQISSVKDMFDEDAEESDDAMGGAEEEGGGVRVSGLRNCPTAVLLLRSPPIVHF